MDSYNHRHHHQSLNREGRWGSTDDFATSFLLFSLFSTALWDLPNSRPVHSLMLSSHLFLCPLSLLPPFTVPWKKVLARPDERETRPYHCSLRLFTIVRRSSCGPIACWIFSNLNYMLQVIQVGWQRQSRVECAVKGKAIVGSRVGRSFLFVWSK